MITTDGFTGIQHPICCGKRSREETRVSSTSPSSKRSKKVDRANRIRKVAVAWLDLKQLVDAENDHDNEGNHGVVRKGSPLVYAGSDYPCRSICLESDRSYTIGRSSSKCQFIFNDPRVSKRHCQIFLDASERKVYLLNGVLSGPRDGVNHLLEEFTDGFLSLGSTGKAKEDKEKEETPSCPNFRFKAPLNGVYVNGFKIRSGSIVELCAGDKVTLVCRDNHGDIGFFIKRIIFQEQVAEQKSEGFIMESPVMSGSLSSGKVNKRVFASKRGDCLHVQGARFLVGRATSLITSCRDIMQSDDPIAYLCQRSVSNSQFGSTRASRSKLKELKCAEVLAESVLVPDAAAIPLKEITNHLPEQASAGIGSNNSTLDQNDTNVSPSKSKDGDHIHPCGSVKLNNCRDNFVLPPGKTFFLNRLEGMPSSSVGVDNVVSLRELLCPLEGVSKIFIATFTNDILWFLSYCKIPCHIPVTMVCHDTVKCWSTDTSNRCSVPYPLFPNLVIVYPPFPEAIAFGEDNKRHGIACHHPKLIILQREENIRVIVSSANLGERQWNRVTNTVWWQDFPRRSVVDYLSLFTHIDDANSSKGTRSDFAAQLAGFMGSLLTDVPIQAHWITELAKYDFSEAKAFLIPSVPGIHTYKARPMAHNIQYLHANQLKSGSSGMMLGSVEASVVGLGHLYRRAVDSNGAQLKKLATFLKNNAEKAYGMFEVVLRRNKNVRADANAMSIHVPNPKDFSVDDLECVQLGFLPRNIAQWVSPLWDAGFFRFTGYIWPKEALTSAIEGNGKKVQLVLHISQGPKFLEMSNGMQHEHVAAFCSLIGSLQRSTGLWRLEEVLGQYKWPEHLETDFLYGASSIGGSVNPKFLAAFSSAAGKKSVEYDDSEESDPEWGCWNSSHELKKPSIKVVYPTIERLRTPQNGLVSSRYILCFAERTWLRLKTSNILHDSVPNPPDRAGHPMHSKVARRRFRSRAGGASFGWVYCGSHNLSAAAWGRLISASASHAHADAQKKGSSSSGGGPKLHVCNYELGVVFIFPPPEEKVAKFNPAENLDDIALPFVVPPPKYGPTDRPATMQAMREALAASREEVPDHATEEGMAVEEEEILEAEEVDEEASCDVEEKEEEKAYAEMLWSQVDSS